MTRYASLAFAAGLALFTSLASAEPQIPTPANPTPDEPVSTNGTPLKQTFGSRTRGSFNALSGENHAWRARHR